MANQAIALQARAPQGNFLAPAIQQGAQFINMMRQQQALDRQTAVAQQTMELQRASAARDEAKAGRDKQTFELDLPGKIYEKHRALGSVAAEGGAPAYAQWLEAYGQDDPKVAAAIQQAMPVDKFDPDRFTRMLATMDQRFEARYGKAIIKEFIGQDGTLMSGNLSGLPGASYAARVPDITSTLKAPQPAAAAPSATGVQPMAAPQTPAPAAGGTFQPISATGGQPQGADPQAALLASLNEAKQTGQIGADVVEQLRQLGGPQAGPRVDAFLAQNNIKVAPGGMRSAVYRPDGGAPMAQQVQYNPNDFPTARVKSPMQSPVPGSAIVPLPRVAAEAAARRETPAEAEARAQASMRGGLKPPEVIQQEAYLARRGQAQADKDTDFLEKYEGVKSRGQTALNAIDSMIGDLTVENGRLKAGKRPPHPGFETVVGFTMFPGARFIEGTDAAGFDAYFKQMEGQAFLQAFETLKGGGQITEIEGTKATAALSRMKRSTNEVEFVKAAREFSDILRRGLEKSDARAARLLGGGGAAAPAAGQTLTPRGRSARPPLASFRG